MNAQNQLMITDPAFGNPKPFPSHATQWREYHGNVAWLFNPWNGSRRHPADIGSDPFGYLTSPRDSHGGPLINKLNIDKTKNMNEHDVGLIARLRNCALADPHDEREVLYAPLLREAANTIACLELRCDALQKAQKNMRDPERKMVCDILANGKTYP